MGSFSFQLLIFTLLALNCIGGYALTEDELFSISQDLVAKYDANPELVPPIDYEELVDDTTDGGEVYNLGAVRNVKSCIIHRKYWLTWKFGFPGCIHARYHPVWLCWYRAHFFNSCQQYTEALFFNCCDKKNGKFISQHPTKDLSKPKGARYPGDWFGCSCRWNISIPPGQNRAVDYSAWGPVNITKSSDRTLTPWNTYLTYAKMAA